MPSAVLAILGALSIVAGVAMVSVPAAVIAAGVLLVVAAYVVRYLEVLSDEVA